MVQLVRCLPCKHEDLILVLNTRGKARCGVCTILGRRRQVDPWGLLVNQPGLINKSQAQVRDPVSKHHSRWMATEVPHLKLISDIHILGHRCLHASIDSCVIVHIQAHTHVHTNSIGQIVMFSPW